MIETKQSNQYYIERQNDFESSARSYPRKFPFALKKAKGSWVEDVEGNMYLDFLCGAGTLALGHNNDEVNRAMIELIESDAPLHTLDLTTPVKDRFVQTILDNLPGDLKDNARIQFCSPSGTDATDAAIKLCKTATGRSTVIAFSGGYHGMGRMRRIMWQILCPGFSSCQCPTLTAVLSDSADRQELMPAAPILRECLRIRSAESQDRQP